MQRKTKRARKSRAENQFVLQPLTLPATGDGYLNSGDLCRLFRTSPVTLWRWIRAKKFPAPTVLQSGSRRWSIATLRAYMRKLEGGAA